MIRDRALVTTTVGIVNGEGLDWNGGGGGSYNNNIYWKPGIIDIVTFPVQIFTIKYRLDSEPAGSNRFCFVVANTTDMYYVASEQNSAGSPIEAAGARDPRSDLTPSFPNGAPGFDSYFVMIQYELDFANDTWKVRLGDDNGGEVWGAWVPGNDSVGHDTTQVEGVRLYGYGDQRQSFLPSGDN